MSNSNTKQGIIISTIGAAIVFLVLGIFIGGSLVSRPAATLLPPTLPPSPTDTPTPTTTPTITPLPSTAPILQPPHGMSNLYIEYILDASGSMLEQLTDGTIKRDAARDYLIDHLLTFSPETHVGLRAYGHRVPWQQKQDSCQDIQLIAPVETGQMEAIAAWLQNFQTQGMTPIYAAVDQAFGDFDSGSKDHLNNIILISDGIETCGGDPCDLVEAATTKGINFTIHVVGLNVDNNARTQLSCMAAKGGGIYYDVHNSGDLKDALHSVQQGLEAQATVVSFAEATAAAMPTDTPVPPTPTQTPTLKPIPTNTRTIGPTRTPGPTRPPRPISPTATKKSSCALPNIVEFKAVPPPRGSTARFTLQYQ